MKGSSTLLVIKEIQMETFIFEQLKLERLTTKSLNYQDNFTLPTLLV